MLHLAAEVGGIGANRANPGRYFYANVAMGIHVIEESRRAGVEKLVQVGTVCAYPKFTPVPFKEDDLWNGYPEETNAPYGIAKKSLLVMLAGVPRAVRLQRHLRPAGQSLRPKRQLRSRDESRHPGTDPEVRDRPGNGSSSRRRVGYRVAPAGNSSTSTTPPGPSCLPPNGTTDPIPSTSAPIARSPSGIWSLLIANLTGFKGEVRWDTTKPDGQPRRMLDTTRAREYFGFEALDRPGRGPPSHHRLVEGAFRPMSSRRRSGPIESRSSGPPSPSPPMTSCWNSSINGPSNGRPPLPSATSTR